MARILFIVKEYPQLSETYIETERREVEKLAKTYLFCRGRPSCETAEHLPYRRILKKGNFEIGWNLLRIRPHVVHVHWLFMAKYAHDIARMARAPWTMRTHSFDILGRSLQELEGYIKYCNEDDCLAVLVFPFQRARLIEAGLKEEKMIDAMPVVDTSKFEFSEGHGHSIINLGAHKPKKAFEQFVRLSTLRPDLDFNLYPMGSENNRNNLRDFAKKKHANIEIHDPVPYSKMPDIWRKHRWLVYTADKELNSVGWPMAAIEAWASGTGVCIQRIRPDIDEYVGNAGIVFDDIEDVADMLSEPPNSDMLDRGRKRAADMDVLNWIDPLFEAWRGAGVSI